MVLLLVAEVSAALVVIAVDALEGCVSKFSAMELEWMRVCGGSLLVLFYFHDGFTCGILSNASVGWFRV